MSRHRPQIPVGMPQKKTLCTWEDRWMGVCPQLFARMRKGLFKNMSIRPGAVNYKRNFGHNEIQLKSKTFSGEDPISILCFFSCNFPILTVN